MRWAKQEIWKKIFEALSIHGDGAFGMLDTTICKAYQHSAGYLKRQDNERIGRSCGGTRHKNPCHL
jgi:hypothetical protein